MPQIQNAKQALNMIKMSQNPQLAFQQMIQSNPQYSQAMQLLNGFNGDINGAINALCQQQGISMQEFMDALNNA